MQDGQPHGCAVRRLLHRPAHRSRTLQNPTGSADQGFRSPYRPTCCGTATVCGWRRTGTPRPSSTRCGWTGSRTTPLPRWLPSALSFANRISHVTQYSLRRSSSPKANRTWSAASRSSAKHIAGQGMCHMVGCEQHVRLLVAHPPVAHLADALMSQPTPCRLHGLHLHSGSMTSLARSEPSGLGAVAKVDLVRR